MCTAACLTASAPASAAAPTVTSWRRSSRRRPPTPKRGQARRARSTQEAQPKPKPTPTPTVAAATPTPIWTATPKPTWSSTATKPRRPKDQADAGAIAGGGESEADGAEAADGRDADRDADGRDTPHRRPPDDLDGVVGRLMADFHSETMSVITTRRWRPATARTLHRHPYEEVFLILEGEATFTLGDETLVARGGDFLIAPPGVPHAFKNTGTGRAAHRRHPRQPGVQHRVAVSAARPSAPAVG